MMKITGVDNSIVSIIAIVIFVRFPLHYETTFAETKMFFLLCARVAFVLPKRPKPQAGKKLARSMAVWGTLFGGL